MYVNIHTYEIYKHTYNDNIIYIITRASLVAQMVKHLPTMWETWVQSLGQEDPLEKEMATHSSTLAWKIPWMEKPGKLQSMGLQSRTRLSDFTFFLSFLSLVAQMVKKPPAMWKIWVWSLGWEDPLEETWQPSPVFFPGESPWIEEPGGLQSMRVAKSWTWLSN